jgi:hypothetical protein
VFEGPEPDEAKVSRPVLRGPGPSNGARLLGEANNDAGLAAHPSRRWAMNCVHFQLAMLAYTLNCWLLLFQREEQSKVEQLQHTTLAIARLRFLFLAAKILRHSGRVGISYSDQYADRGLFQRLMNRLRKVAPRKGKFLPVLATALLSWRVHKFLRTGREVDRTSYKNNGATLERRDQLDVD